FNSSNCLADTPWLAFSPRIVHRADPARLGKAVHLPDRNAQHGEEILRLRRKRRRSANEPPKIRPEALANSLEDHFLADEQLPAVAAFRSLILLSLPRFDRIAIGLAN